MFDHLSIGVSNLNRSLAFYDAALKPLGISRMFAMAGGRSSVLVCFQQTLGRMPRADSCL